MVEMKKLQFNFKEVAPCFYAVLVDILGFGVIFPVLTAFVDSPSGLFPPTASDETRYFFLGLSFFLFPIMMFFGSIILGHFSDKFGRKSILLTCMMGLAISFCVIGLGVHYKSLLWLLIGRAASGLMAASEPTALAAIVDLSTEKNKALHMSYIAIAQSIGFVFGPLIGGVFSNQDFYKHFDFDTPFYICGVFALLGFIWILTSFKETKMKEQKGQEKRSPFYFIHALKSSKIAILSVAFFLMQFGMSVYFQLILVELQKKYNYDTLMMGIYNGYYGLWFAVALIFIIPHLVKRYKIEKITCVFILLLALSQIAISFVHKESSIWILTIFLAIAVQIAYTGMYASYSNAADRQHQGLVMGLSGSIMALSWALSGFSPTLVPLLTVQGVIFFGGVLLLISSGYLYYYCRKFIQ